MGLFKWLSESLAHITILIFKLFSSVYARLGFLLKFFYIGGKGKGIVRVLIRGFPNLWSFLALKLIIFLDVTIHIDELT